MYLSQNEKFKNQKRSHFLILNIYFLIYSVLRLLTGFAAAAFIAWKLTVIIAISITKIAADANIHHDISIR